MSACINSGGPDSRITLQRTPQLEAVCPLDDHAQAALQTWRARPGEIVTLCGPQNDFYRARLLKDDEGRFQAYPFELLAAPAESELHLSVVQALPQRERFELVLQKLTELGVQRIIPCETEYSITQLERDAGQKKSHRWPDVILRAARQCRRAELPELYPVLEREAVIEAVADCDLRLLLKEGAAPWRMREIVAREKPRRVALLVGPEGGFDASEVEAYGAAGFIPVSLGARILRTETAAIVGAALLQSAFGDLG